MLRRFLPLVVALAALLTSVALAGPAAAAAPPHTPSGLPSTIEPLAPYVAQTSCDPTTKPGTRKLAQLLTATYRGTRYNTVYACGTDGSVSEHYDGRAIDWMVSIRNTGQHADAKAVLAWLLATDSRGHKFAIARRLGVQYVIYDNKIWGSWNGRWDPYNGCAKLTSRSYDTSCHRDHMHISLSWNGATGRTSFWTKRVYGTDYGPCRYADLNWSPNRWRVWPTPCPSLPTVRPAKGASKTKVALVKYSGAALHGGLTGPAVTAVQHALHVRATNRFDAATIAALRKFQAAHHVALSHSMTVASWRALLRATR